MVLTTNHVEKINPAMLRPGRLDAVISVRPPDKGRRSSGCSRLYGRGLIPKEEDLSSVGKKLEGLIPALIREVVERASSRPSTVSQMETLEIFQTDLLAATETMIAQNKLVNPNVKPEPHPLQLFRGSHGAGDRTGNRRGTAPVTERHDVHEGRRRRGRRLRLETVNLVADSMTNGGKTPEVKKMANRSSKSPLGR